MAFSDCSSLSKVYYKGTKSEWAKINVDYNYNYDITGVTRYYYSESAPVTAGNYWHYDASGNIAEW